MTKRKSIRRRGSRKRKSLKYNGNAANNRQRCKYTDQCPPYHYCLYHSPGVYFCEEDKFKNRQPLPPAPSYDPDTA